MIEPETLCPSAFRLSVEALLSDFLSHHMISVQSWRPTAIEGAIAASFLQAVIGIALSERLQAPPSAMIHCTNRALFLVPPTFLETSRSIFPTLVAFSLLRFLDTLSQAPHQGSFTITKEKLAGVAPRMGLHQKPPLQPSRRRPPFHPHYIYFPGVLHTRYSTLHQGSLTHGSGKSGGLDSGCIEGRSCPNTCSSTHRKEEMLALRGQTRLTRKPGD